MWAVEACAGFEKRRNKLAKDYPREVAQVAVNFEKFLEALRAGTKPQNIRAPFVRSERKGVLAITEAGAKGNTKRVPLRLYVYPQEPPRVLHVITLGDKNTQEMDIRDAHRYVDELRREAESREGDDGTLQRDEEVQ